MKTADYLAALERHAQEAYAVAKAARTRGLDPAPQPEVFVARNMAERVIGLLSVVAPQLVGMGAEARIFELEAQYGVLDWRVALKLAEDIAQERFCSFHDRREAMEVGLRAGFTYITLGVVSSPLEGFTGLEIKRRRDGKEYFCLNYSGPIRNAGGTAASVSVLIGDYIRARFGYAPYDPDERERKRTFIELGDYHEQVTNLQYVPSEAEVDFLMAHLPVEISGDPSEKHEVSNVNYKDLERVPTNRLRSGFCLIHSSCIPLKAPKLWKALKAWGAQFGLGHWGFLEAFLAIQKTAKAKGKASSSPAAKLAPDYTYIHDLVAGRPVLAHPLRSGGFRLRYGRSRVSGFSAQAIHPATMHVLNGFVATATQLKVERPGKAAAYAPCDTIDGPIVKLHDGSVLALASEKDALAVKSQVAEILYLGDVLVNYGDFYNRAHPLVPAGYCPEFWAQELKAALEGAPEKRVAPRRPRSAGIPEDRLLALQSDPLRTPPTFEEAVALSRSLGVPLHPAYTYFWSSLEAAQLADLIAWLCTAAFEDGKLILGLPGAKRALEVLGVPHRAVLGEHVVIEGPHSAALLFALGATAPEDLAPANGSPDAALAAVSARCPVPLRDKAGVFIGARMGRPEKAKMRRLVGSPHVLFPVGTEGGRLRCFQSALERGRVTANFPLYRCNPCRTQTIYAVCERCRGRTTPLRSCPSCGTIEGCPHESLPYSRQALDIKHYFEAALRELGTEIYPDLIKGVKGTSNQDHVPEYLPKGILRAKHNIAVNKDGTTRVDCSEVTLTHFKPKEIHVDVATLRRLGYATDIHGKALESEEQILELKVQDIVLPCCRTSPDEPADEVLFRVSRFVDELLLTVYGLPAHYNLRGPKDLVGAHIIGLAPHTSAGILGRIIGFSSTQGFLAHPLFHAAMRRDCDGDESSILQLMD